MKKLTYNLMMWIATLQPEQAKRLFFGLIIVLIGIPLLVLIVLVWFT